MVRGGRVTSYWWNIAVAGQELFKFLQTGSPAFDNLYFYSYKLLLVLFLVQEATFSKHLLPYVDTTSFLTLKDPPSHVYILLFSENTVMYSLFVFSEVLTSTNEFPEKFRYGLYALWEVILIEVRFTFISSLILFHVVNGSLLL